MRQAAAALVLLLGASAPSAGAPQLSQPVDCVLGQSCHIQHLVDRDPGPGVLDHACGALSYDGHNGTDFALPTLAAMAQGVEVIAAAPGIVAATRDGMPDQRMTAQNEDQIAGRDCGNGVLIRHGDGWETQYCHMMRGSIRVRPGDRVDRGAVLGLVGLSGRTQFPHLHLSVRQEGRVIDPFDIDESPACDGAAETLWTDPPAYQPGGLIAAGFADRIPAWDSITAGVAGSDTLPTDAPALVVYGHAFGARAGDRMRLVIDGPDGQVIDQDMTLEKSQAQLFRAAGKRSGPRGWTPGIYTGRVTMTRDGKLLSETTTTLTIR